MTSPFSTPEVRIEGRDKVSGSAAYAADFEHADALEVAFVRSPMPHARIVDVDVTDASQMPGVVAVVTGADLVGVRLGRRLQDWPALVGERVLMVGDRIAAVAAETKLHAEAAARAVVVEYEELEPVLSPERALEPGAPILHPDADSYHYISGDRPHRSHENVQGERHHEHGDVAGGFAAAAHVFEHEFAVPKGFTGYLEPRAAMAWIEEDTLHLLTTNKSPFRLRDQMAMALGVAEESIVVHTGTIGGDFGGKGLSIDEFTLGHLARQTGRRVRTVTGFADDMSTTTSRHAATLRLRTGVDADGRFVAHEATVLVDGGAYAAGKPNPELVPSKAHVTLSGYRVPAARLDVTCAYTNTLVGSNARSPGQPQSAFAGESHIDMIATELGVDPLELRLRNAITDGETDVAGSTWESSTMTVVLEAMRSEMNSRALRGGFERGIAAGSRGVASGEASVRVTVIEGGRIEVVTGATDQGGGAYTMIQRVVATELGVPVDLVVVRGADTSKALWDKGVGGSRVTPVVGGAAHAGAVALRSHFRDDQRIGDQLGAHVGLSVEGNMKHPSGVHSTAACFADVNVDRETGEIDVDRIVVVADVGTIINPVSARGQLIGGIANGLGYALMEELTIEDGQITSANLSEYKLPTIADMPEMDVVFLEDDKGLGPFGAKSTGELSNYLVAPAIANAIDRAVGVRVTSLPITAEKVWAAMHHHSPSIGSSNR